MTLFLETERLSLRRFKEGDFTDFCAYAIDPEMCRMTGWKDMLTAEDARPVFDRLLADERGYAVVLKDTGSVIGNFSVSPLHPFLKNLPELQGKNGCCLSFVLSRLHRRKGLIFEAARAVIDHLFRVEEMEFINAGYFSYNVPSRGLQEKLGFQYLGTHGFRRGEDEIEVIENVIYREDYIRVENTMFLETPRLSLRKFQETDFADFCEYAIDPEMCRMMGRDDIHDAESARPTFDWLMNKEERGYVIVHKENNKVIGNITVYNTPSIQAVRPELAGKVGRGLSFSMSRHYQRRGLMFEAVSSLIEKLFRDEGVDYISCGHFPFNIASGQLQKKLGFSYLFTERFQAEDREIVSIENILWRV